MANLFRKLFPKSQRTPRTTPKLDESPTSVTLKAHSQPPTTAPPAKKALEPPQLLAGCGYSTGKQRDHNEDSFFSMTTTVASNENNLSVGLYIVADGMGGYKYGEIASGIAIRVMANHAIKKVYTPLFSQPASTPGASLMEIMQEGVQAAQRAILKETPGGGTTLTAVLILGKQMTIAHVGDSRVYAIHADGRVEVLTRDHTLVKRLEELGQITAEEAAVHKQRNVLYRALGQGDAFDADILTAHAPESGHLLLCSDGLWGAIPDDEISRIVRTAASPVEASQALVEAANAAGGSDNITALVVRLHD